MKRTAVIFHCGVWASCLFQYSIALAQEFPSISAQISSQDVLLLARHGGQIVYKTNETRKFSPASTLKVLTALTAIHHMGRRYRFPTEFYLDRENNLTIKGYGDPLLISEIWENIAATLASKVASCKDIILDDSYFVSNISIPGIDRSTNPYDAPVGALCANFNTVFFERDEAGRLVSAEPQTPLTPMALDHMDALGLDRDRHTVVQTSAEAARYAGELFAHFFRKKGADFRGTIRRGIIGEEDRLIYRYDSVFALEENLQRMLEYSNNFMANQILLALGAHMHGPPGTLNKGVRVVCHYAKAVLGLKHIEIVEGSGVSRQNKVSALDMLGLLRAFEPYRRLLPREGPLLYKTGTLKDLKTAAGYIEFGQTEPYYFVAFLHGANRNMDALLAELAASLHERHDASRAYEK